MRSTKVMMRGAVVLALLGVAAPAFPCGAAKQTNATSDTPAVSKDAVASKTPADNPGVKPNGTKKAKAATASN